MGKKSKKRSETELKCCDECKQELPKGRFSNKQWNFSKESRCKTCDGRMKDEINMKLNAFLAEDDMISDEDLFKEPPSTGDCPICFLRMPLKGRYHCFLTCCGQEVCGGCLVVRHKSSGKDRLCPLCRQPEIVSDDENVRRMNQRSKLNDPIALFNLGCTYGNRKLGLPKDKTKALLYWIRAGELGYYKAFAGIANNFVGDARSTHFCKRAAMLGDVVSRYNLGVIENYRDGNKINSMKHFKMAAKAGHKDSLDALLVLHKNGFVTKDEYEQTLRAYLESLNELKSGEREEAAPMIRNGYANTL